MEKIIENALKKRNQQIANLLYNTGKLTIEEIKNITNASPENVDGLHGVDKPKW